MKNKNKWTHLISWRDTVLDELFDSCDLMYLLLLIGRHVSVNNDFSFYLSIGRL